MINGSGESFTIRSPQRTCRAPARPVILAAGADHVRCANEPSCGSGCGRPLTIGVTLNRTVIALTCDTAISTGCPVMRIADSFAVNDCASSNATTPAEPMLFNASLRDGFSFIIIRIKWPYFIFHMAYGIWHMKYDPDHIRVLTSATASRQSKGSDSG